MKKIAVIYKSAYGTTKRYAEWIAEELNASLFEASGVKPAQLKEYDVIIYGGGLYAGGILGVKFVTKNPCKSLTIFTVGLADPETTDYSEILKKNFTPDFLSAAKVYHLRGGIDYKECNRQVETGQLWQIKSGHFRGGYQRFVFDGRRATRLL